MNTLNRNEFMENGVGHLVPISKVEEIDKLRDDLVRDLVGDAEKLRDGMIQYKKKAYSEVAAFVALSVAEYGKTYGGKKGNLKFCSYDHSLMIQVQISEHMTCDERLQGAKEIIDGCFERWTKDGKDEIKTVINEAFTVNKEGNINIRQILGLRRYAIKDPDWVIAMEMISDSLQVSGSKSYFRVYKRTGPEGKYVNIPLDFASL